MNKSESKYFNTAVRMDEALLTLLEKKSFPYITVKEICAIAGVNRSTFYLHYENTSDLLKEATKYVLDKHFACYGIDIKEMMKRIESCEPKELIFITNEYLVPYLTFIKENRRIFKLAINRFEVMNMDEVYGKMFKLIFEPILARFRVPEKERPYVIKFYLTGVFAIVMEWLDGECEESISFITEVIDSCVMGAHNV